MSKTELPLEVIGWAAKRLNVGVKWVLRPVRGWQVSALQGGPLAGLQDVVMRLRRAELQAA